VADGASQAPEKAPEMAASPLLASFRKRTGVSAILSEGVTYDITRRLDKEAIKVRILSLLKDRPLSNKDIRNFTDLGRKQVTGLLKELEADGQVRSSGHGAGSLWHLRVKD